MAELRVLGALIEKRATTPDHYPLSTNALVTACNQKTNREPVTDLTERQVLDAMLELRALKLCRSVPSGRTDKHKHVLDDALGLDEAQLAVLAVMMLRGPQTPGELRTRTDRYVDFGSVEEVQSVLDALVAGERPLVADLGRGPGQSQNRYMHLLGGPVDSTTSVTSAPPSGPSRSDRLETLESTVISLIDRVTRLENELGLDAGASEPETLA